MKLFGKIATITSLLWLVACGGGGGSGGTPGGGTGPDPNAPGGTLTVQVYSNVSGTEAAVSTFAASDQTVHARTVLKDKAGNPIANAIVTFSESGAGLLTFQPTAATALTDKEGKAQVDLKATSLTGLGATQLVATTIIQPATGSTGSAVTLTANQNVSVSSAVVADPQATAAAINFVSANPSDSSIVIAGSGGNGRSEIAMLTFSVKDGTGAVLQGVKVDFTAVPAGSVTLNNSTGTTDSTGQVVAVVNSKSTPTSVIINATVRGRAISTQSDTLTVTTGTATQLGFDLSASKFNLDSDLSGDSSTITVRVVDKNGNPVADGLAVIATTNYGAVGTSGRGGCTTSNGACTVPYTVQNPRPADGAPVSVVFSTQTGQGQLISDTLNLFVTSIGNANFYSSQQSTSPVSSLSLTMLDATACTFRPLQVVFGTAAGFAAPSGTTIAVRSDLKTTTPTITSGSPTLDRAAARTAVSFAASGVLGNGAGTDTWVFTITAPASKAVKTISIPVSYPACPKPDPTPTPGTGGTGGTGGTVIGGST